MITFRPYPTDATTVDGIVEELSRQIAVLRHQIAADPHNDALTNKLSVLSESYYDFFLKQQEQLAYSR